MARNNSDSDSNRGRSRLNRRSMLMALGAGPSVALTSPYSAASLQEGGDGDGDDAGDGGGGGGGRSGSRFCPPCIDPYSGYLRVEERKDLQPLGNIDPVTTVELRVTDADVVFPEPSDTGTETTAPATEITNETVAAGTDAANGTVAEGTETTNGTIAAETETGSETGTPGGPRQEMPDFYFDPVGIAVEPGDAVEYLIREELHTVTAFHPRFGFQKRVPDAAVGFTSPPFLEGDSWYYRFDEPGVYDMLCLPHFGLGMVMRAVVIEEGAGEVPEAEPLPGPDAEEQALPPVDRKVLGAPELDPQNVVEEGPVQWTDLSNVASELPGGS